LLFSGERANGSIAAVVGSMDKCCTKFYTVTRAQLGREKILRDKEGVEIGRTYRSLEHIVDFQDMVHEIIKNFWKKNNKKRRLAKSP
jgi:hypothetical protein